MLTLPTLTVTDAQAQRLIAAFGSSAEYKQWLKKQLIAYVINYEQQARYLAVRQQGDADLEALTTELNNA